MAHSPKIFKVALTTITAVIFSAAIATAQDTMLTLTNSNTGVEILLSEDDVMALDQAILHTENEFVDAMTAFEGPLARDLLAMMDADLTDTVILTASNDYAIEVPVSDFFDYDVVLALSTDGTRLSMRDKGPIWVVYPISDHSELDDPVYNARLIWQLVRMDIK